MAIDYQEGRSQLRVPPSNVDAEESVLGSAMISADAVNVVMDSLEPGDFYKPAHQLIFEAIVELFDANQAIDAITVSDALSRRGQLDRMGGIAYLTGLIDKVPTASNAAYYATIVEENALRRRLLDASAGIGGLAFEDADIAEVMDQAEQAIFKVAERRMGDGLVPVRPLVHSTLEQIEELGARGSEITGVPTGFKDLDRRLAGLHPANLVVVAARPSMGKSALAGNIALNVALAGHPVAVFTLEMSREEVVQRLLCSKGRVDSQKLRTGQLGENEWQRVARAAGELFEAPFYVDDSASLTVTEIRAKCRRLKRQQGLGLVVVDYIQLMTGGNRRTENRQQEIAEISRNLKNLARELHVPIIAVSQLNRALEQRQDKRPMLGDLRESGAIEQDADVVMFIYRDEYYHPENIENKGVAEVNVAKHRAGSTGRVDMTFLGEFTLFSDLGRDVAV
jgi:replicative DNA helicase